jgi:MYXO-CTERM domain-containing protein
MTRPLASFGNAAAALALSMAAITWPAAARAEVLFENPGNTMGWDRLFTQKAGTINEVSSPVYRGTTAVKTTQTYQTSDGKNYHSEIIKARAHLAGQDLYYGHAIYLPADWVFHSQNVTFQQWAPEMPEAPWILMYLQGDRVRLGGRGANGDKDVGPITGLRGTWIRTVTRIHMATDGAFEVWINGEKFFSQKGNFRAHGPSMRWSNGIYCTRWDTERPTGPRELTIWHDNLRIATTFEEADPGSWGEGASPPPADAGASADAAPDAGEPDAGGAGAGGAGGGNDGSGGRAAAAKGGASGAGSGTGGSDGEEPAASSVASSGCRVAGGGGSGGPGWLGVVAGVLLLSIARRRHGARRVRRPRGEDR